MELNKDFFIPTNEFQTSITAELLNKYPQDVIQNFLDVVENIPYIHNLIAPDRKRAKDLPRDSTGKIIVDLTNPHILEDMDYFRPSALHFQEHECYTFLKPNANPNSEYYKWFQEEKRRCYEGYVRESDGEWVTGYMYFYLNYNPIMLTELSGDSKAANRVEALPLVWEGIYLRFHYLDQARISGEHAIELARRGAHPYDETVYTPDGIKKWGDIKIGDFLYDILGKPTEVIDIPFDNISDCYKITLRDGRIVYTDGNHTWNVIRKNTGIVQQKTTKELLSCYKLIRNSPRIPSGIEYQYFIPGNCGVDFVKKEVPFDSYTLGYLLGDGCFRSGNYNNQILFTSDKRDIDTYKTNIPYNISKITKDDYTYKVEVSTQHLKDIKLWNCKSEDKFIPNEYIINDRSNRLSLLQGLMDSDGHTHGGIPTYSTSSKKLKDNVLTLARSLGYNCNYIIKKAGYKKEDKYIECLDCYSISIYGGPELFRLQRKKDKVNTTKFVSRNTKTAIINIEYIGYKQCKCVEVDSFNNSYLINEFVQTHNCSKSYTLASIMAKNVVLGENAKTTRRNMTVLAANSKEYLGGKDGTLTKFEPVIDYLSDTTEFPRLRLNSSLNDMVWRYGYKNSLGINKGSLNTVIGVSVKDNEGKLRGKRGYILFEEMGSFPNLLSTYNNTRYGVEEGEFTFGLMYLVGTAADDASDFSAAKELLYNTKGYNIKSLPNVYDKQPAQNKTFGYFYPAYLNRKGCDNKDGVSDVVKALLEILMKRYNTKMHSSDINTIMKVIAEMPITPAEAIIKVTGSNFPIAAMTERLTQLESDKSITNSDYIVDLVLDKNGKVICKNSTAIPIKSFPLKDEPKEGAIIIHEMPCKNSSGEVPSDRYVMGHDPVDNDMADSKSLASTFILDVITDTIVAELTGRQPYADLNYENVRLMCMFYNTKCLFESNKKGIYAYFNRMSSTHLLKNTPEYLREKDMVKYTAFGSNIKGVNASPAINNYADGLILEWLIKPVQVVVREDKEEKIITLPNLYKIKDIALLKELIAYNPEINVDRVRALGMTMLYREELMIRYNGDASRVKDVDSKDDLCNDAFFNRNYDEHIVT